MNKEKIIKQHEEVQHPLGFLHVEDEDGKPFDILDHVVTLTNDPTEEHLADRRAVVKGDATEHQEMMAGYWYMMTSLGLIQQWNNNAPQSFTISKQYLKSVGISLLQGELKCL